MIDLMDQTDNLVGRLIHVYAGRICVQANGVHIIAIFHAQSSKRVKIFIFDGLKNVLCNQLTQVSSLGSYDEIMFVKTSK